MFHLMGWVVEMPMAISTTLGTGLGTFIPGLGHEDQILLGNMVRTLGPKVAPSRTNIAPLCKSPFLDSLSWLANVVGVRSLWRGR